MKLLFKWLLIVNCTLFIIHCSKAQFINNNAFIKVNAGATIFCTNSDFIINTGSLIDNEGSIILNESNWINNSGNNNVFTNMNSPGEVVMQGGKTDSIYGNINTIFASLTIADSVKKLGINNCEVTNTLTLERRGVLDLNLNTLIINNSSNTAVTTDNSGYILSEKINHNYKGPSPNDNVYGDLQWNIGNQTGKYMVPFGDKQGDSLNLTVNILSAGSPSTGYFNFATYPTNSENLPLPSVIKTFSGLDSINIADRYWKINANYSSKPNVNISFQYATSDVNPADNQGMKKGSLLAMRYNSNSNTWLDMAAMGKADSNNLKVTTGTVESYELYDWWALVAKSSLIIPNVFTPDRSHNSKFITQLVQGNDEINSAMSIISLHGKIFNRWGVMVYWWDNDDWWTGTDKRNGMNLPEDTYFYVITATGSDGTNYNKAGSITLLR